MSVRKPKDLDKEFIKNIENQYGPLDMENDFFNNDLSMYYKTTSINKETGKIGHKPIELANFGDSLKQLHQALKALQRLSKTKQIENDVKIKSLYKELRDTFNSYRTHLRKNYNKQYEKIKHLINEISSTVGTSTFTPGQGAQISSPQVFRKTNKQYKYKLVPDKIKESGLEVKKLYEEDNNQNSAKVFQNEREKAFDKIEEEMNVIYKGLNSAKNETINYYKEFPNSFEIVKPTDLILSYLKDIKSLLEL